jgi:acyl-CoA synthetase (AMP-forming)/AMP-acid ligase II
VSAAAPLSIRVGDRAKAWAYVGLGKLRIIELWLGVPLAWSLLSAVDDISSCVEIEEILLARLPQAREIVIIASGEGTSTPVITTEADRKLAPEAEAQAIRDLPPMADPVHIPFAEMPFTATWKVRRFLLRERLAARSLEAVV